MVRKAAPSASQKREDLEEEGENPAGDPCRLWGEETVTAKAPGQAFAQPSLRNPRQGME